MFPRRLLTVLLCFLAWTYGRAEEPAPIQRVELPPERVPAEMQRVGQGVLTQLPRAVFEELVRKAAAAEAAGKTPPRLVDARYKARLDGNGLVGTAEWKVVHAHETPGRLSLAGLQLALRSARWADDVPAIVGVFDDRPGVSPELLVDRKGERTLKLDWSARGVPELGGIRFELRVPACPITSLELELPADHDVQVDRDNAVLSGPLPARDASSSLWRVSFPRSAGGALSARLSIRRPTAADQPPPVTRTFIQATQRLTPGQVDCEFQLDVQVQRGELRRLILKPDGGLRVLELQAPGLDGWTPEAANQINVTFREPFRGGRITLHGVAPLPPSEQGWVSPTVRIADGLSRGERLTLHVDPDLQVEDWKPGGFRPLPTTDAGTGQVIALQLMPVGPAAGVRPQARIRSVAGSFRTRETWEWRVEPDRMLLTVDVQFIARRGPMFQSVWQVPAEWQVERVEAEPLDPGLRSTILPGAGGSPALLTVESRRPFAGGPELDARRLMIRLRAGGPAWSAGPDGPSAVATTPALMPRGAETREGKLTLKLDPSVVAPFAGSTLRPDVAQPFRGRPDASVHLRHRRGRVQARCDVDAVLGHDTLRTTYSLTLTPIVAAGQEFLLSTFAPVAFESVRATQGAISIRGVAAVSLPFVGATGFWRVSLDRPLTSPVVLELVARSRSAVGRVVVPLLAVVGAERSQGRVVVRSLPGDWWRADSTGLIEEPADSVGDGWARRAFTFGAQPNQLTVDRTGAVATTSPQLAAATLVIRPTLEGPTYHLLSFSVGHWARREFPVELPVNVESVMIRIDGAALSMSSAKSVDGTVVLPWNPARSWAKVEVAYTLPGEPLRSCSRHDVDKPKLPLAGPIRRIWRLPTDVIPLSLSPWRALPGSATHALSLLNLADGSPASVATSFGRSSPPRPDESLASWLARAGAETGDGAVVVDAVALGEAGVDASTPLVAGPALAGLGLVALTLSRGVLVTSRSALDAWGGRLSPPLLEALEQAAVNGHDPSGRFRSAAAWRAGPVSSPNFESDGGWTDWEPVTGESQNSLWLMRWWVPHLIGSALALAVVMLVIGAAGARRAALISAILVAAAGLIWLPSLLWGFAIPPLITALVLLAVFAIWSRRRAPAVEEPSSRRSNLEPVVIATGLALAAVAAFPGVAATPGPTVVFIVPGAGAGKQDVLAPPELLESLRKSARQAEPAFGALLQEARYEGSASGGEVRWKAQFVAFSFRDAGATVTIALPDVQMLSTEVDGRAALPSPGGEGRFEFAMAGRGAHSLTLRFATPVTGEGDRETRFSVPELPFSSCVVDFPSGMTEVQILSARGVQRVAAQRLEADLGRAGLVNLRWRSPSTLSKARTPVQAAHMWEIGDAQARLVSVFRFRFGAASARRLEFDVPAELELADAFVRNVDEPLRLTGLNSAAEWRQADVDGRRRHRLDFAAPLTGQVQVELELVPRRPLQAQPALGFPEVVGDFERETAAAVRLTDLSATALDSQGWVRMPGDDFLHDVWQPLRVDSLNREPELAFRRARAAGEQLRIDLKRHAAAAVGSQKIHWLVGAGRADLEASATWAEAPTSGLLEWDVPAVVAVAELRGDGLRSWSRTGGRLQAWLLPNPVGGLVTLTLTGSVPRPADEQANAQAPFTVPPMTPVGMSRVTTELMVQAREGWRLRSQAPGPFVMPPTNDLPGVSWSGVASTAGPAVFALRRSRGRASGDLVTVVEMSGRQPGYSATADVAVTAAEGDDVATLLVELRRAEDERPQLTLPAGVRLRETRTTAQGTTWVLDCLPGRHRLTLTGRLLGATSIAVPVVTIRGAGEQTSALRRFVAVGPGIRPGTTTGLRPAALPAERGNAKAWQVIAEDWELRVSGGGDVGTRGQVVAEVAAVPAEEGRWLMRARCLFVIDSDMTVRMPEGVEFLAARLDGLDLPRGAESGRLTLPPAAGKARTLTLVWKTPSQPARPKLELPRLEAVGEVVPMAAVSWTVLAPAGTHFEATTTTVGAASAAVHRAAALAELLRGVDSQLTPEARGRLRGQLHDALRRANQALAGSPASANEPAPDGETLVDWLKRLRQNAPPDATDRDEPLGPYVNEFERGMPMYWFAADAAPPAFRLVKDVPDPGPRVALSIVLLVGVLAGALITRRRSAK